MNQQRRHEDKMEKDAENPQEDAFYSTI